jgi:hypothetical protein
VKAFREKPCAAHFGFLLNEDSSLIEPKIMETGIIPTIRMGAFEIFFDLQPSA